MSSLARAAFLFALLAAAGCGSGSSHGGAPRDGGAESNAPDGGLSGDSAPDGDATTEAAPSGDATTDDTPAPLPVHGIFNVKDHGAIGDGTTNDTAAIQATIAAATNASGGIVYFPKGRYRIEAGLSAGAAITLAGDGFTVPAAGAAESSLAGSWIIVDKSLLGTAAITLAGAGATARDVGVFHEQPAPGAGWQPRAFGWAIDLPSTDTLVRHVWLENPTLGIRGIGRVTIENVGGEPITTGIRIEYAYDVVRLRHIRFDWTADGAPVWSSDASVTSRLGTAIESLRDDNPEIYDVKVNGYATGIHFGANAASGSNPAGATSKFSLMDTTVSNATRCVTIDGANTTGKMTRFWGQGCGVTGLWLHAPGAVVSAADLDLRNMTANAVRVDAAGAAFLGNQLNVVNWNTSGSGFPAFEAADPNASVKIGYYRSFTGSGPQVGGVGTAVVDNNAGDTAYNLRVPTPTEVTEDGLEPFGAKIDVLQYGAAGDGKTDDTAAIQAALDAAHASGGGAVLVPAGDYLVKGSIQIPSGVSLVGVGWNVTADKGARLLVDAANTSDVVVLGNGATLRSIGMHWNQGNVASGFQPRSTFGWGVRVTGTNVTVRDLFMLNPTKGIFVSSTGTGPVLLDRIVGSPLSVGLEVDTNAALRANDVHFWPFWGVCAGSPPNGCQSGTFAYFVNSPKEASGVAFRFDHSAHAEISNAFSIGYATGMLFGQNSAGQVNSDLRVWNADQDIFGARGYSVSGANTQATLANWSCQGDNGTDQAITGLWTQASATGAKIDGYNGDLRIFTANAVRAEGAGASVLVNLMRFDSWNLSGAGFPVVEGASGASAGAGPEAWENGK
jgi:Pectate lyase superfamily protein